MMLTDHFCIWKKSRFEVIVQWIKTRILRRYIMHTLYGSLLCVFFLRFWSLWPEVVWLHGSGSGCMMILLKIVHHFLLCCMPDQGIKENEFRNKALFLFLACMLSTCMSGFSWSAPLLLPFHAYLGLGEECCLRTGLYFLPFSLFFFFLLLGLLQSAVGSLQSAISPSLFLCFFFLFLSYL